MADTDIDAILESHNKRREIHKAKPLVWDDECFTTAQKWAENLATAAGKLGKDGKLRGLHHGGLVKGMGQNVWWTAEDASPEDAVVAWMREARRYDPAVPSSAGNFTQVVWKRTKKVGLGIVHVPRPSDIPALEPGVEIDEAHKYKYGTFVVANYFPHGNTKGKFEANVYMPPKPPPKPKVEKEETPASTPTPPPVVPQKEEVTATTQQTVATTEQQAVAVTVAATPPVSQAESLLSQTTTHTNLTRPPVQQNTANMAAAQNGGPQQQQQQQQQNQYSVNHYNNNHNRNHHHHNGKPPGWANALMDQLQRRPSNNANNQYHSNINVTKALHTYTPADTFVMNNGLQTPTRMHSDAVKRDALWYNNNRGGRPSYPHHHHQHHQHHQQQQQHHVTRSNPLNQSPEELMSTAYAHRHSSVCGAYVEDLYRYSDSLLQKNANGDWRCQRCGCSVDHHRRAQPQGSGVVRVGMEPPLYKGTALGAGMSLGGGNGLFDDSQDGDDLFMATRPHQQHQHHQHLQQQQPQIDTSKYIKNPFQRPVPNVLRIPGPPNMGASPPTHHVRSSSSSSSIGSLDELPPAPSGYRAQFRGNTQGSMGTGFMGGYRKG